MDIAAGLRSIHHRSSLLSSSLLAREGTAKLSHRFRTFSASTGNSRRLHIASMKTVFFGSIDAAFAPRALAVAVETAETEASTAAEEIEFLLSESSTNKESKKSAKKSSSGASSVSSGIRLENISKSFKGVTVLKDVSWEVKKGEKVGLVGVNGAGKTTQLRIIAGLDEPDAGNLVKSKENMKIAFLSQEFEVCLNRTVKEEFLNAFKEEMEISERLEKMQKALEKSVDDLALMGRLLDELDLLQRRAQDVNLDMVNVKISKIMPELGFTPEDADRLVASFSGGWQMRMSLGKILLQACYG